MSAQLTFVDLFSGAGGLLLGFLNAGYRAQFSVECWRPAVETHRLNYPEVALWTDDIRTISDERLSPYAGQVDVVVGGPPCQGFSTIGKRLVADPRNELVFEFVRFVSTLRPRAFLMENVRGLLSSCGGEVKEAVESEFTALGYKVRSQVLCAVDYGVPQKRYRLFFLGLRNDIPAAPTFPAATTPFAPQQATVGDAIMDLAGMEGQVPNHVPLHHNAIVRGRIRCIAEGQGLPSEGLPAAVSMGSRSDFRERRVKNFSHVYRRLSRQQPATTMAPSHNAFPLHPTEDRSLTVREAARLQTFPDDVVFCGTRQNQCIQVGNAVPVLLAEALARHIATLTQLSSLKRGSVATP